MNTIRIALIFAVAVAFAGCRDEAPIEGTVRSYEVVTEGAGDGVGLEEPRLATTPLTGTDVDTTTDMTIIQEEAPMGSVQSPMLADDPRLAPVPQRRPAERQVRTTAPVPAASARDAAPQPSMHVTRSVATEPATSTQSDDSRERARTERAERVRRPRDETTPSTEPARPEAEPTPERKREPKPKQELPVSEKELPEGRGTKEQPPPQEDPPPPAGDVVESGSAERSETIR